MGQSQVALILPLRAFWRLFAATNGRHIASMANALAAFERLTAWQACYRLALEIYCKTAPWPKHELYGLTSQVRRAAYSAAANIAEGAAKRGPREFRR